MLQAMNTVSRVPEHPRHRFLVPTVLVVATVIAFFACFAVWANRQALSTSNWTKTSGRIVGDPRVQSALSVYLVNELFATTNVTGRLEEVLPGELKGVAGPVTAGLRQVAGAAVPKLLASPQVQELWENANRAAHRQLLAILNGGGSVVSTQQGEVKLNLHELLLQLGAQVGLRNQVESAQKQLASPNGQAARGTVQQRLGITLPPSSGVITIMKAKQLKTAQDIAKAIKGLAIVLPLVALALYALAVWLATDRRRRALRATGWCLFGVGIVLLIARRIAGEQIVNNLVAVPANKPAAEAVWSIGTSLLYNIAIAMLLYGLVVVAAAWLAGHTRPATSLRRAAAPWMREHAVGSYVAAGVLLLLVVLWGPTQATRQVLPVLGFALLAAFGVSILRRQTAEEFPDAMPGEAMAALRMRMPFGRQGGASPARTADGAGAPPASAAPPAAGAAPVPGAESPAAPPSRPAG
jgi:cytochrome b561